MTNNKQKGKRVEREAADILTDITGKEWKRTVFSGAMSGHREDKVYKGDVHCTEELVAPSGAEMEDLVVEVKSRKDSIKLQELMNEDSKFFSHVKQAMNQSPYFWLLLIKVNYEGWFAVTDIGGVKALLEDNIKNLEGRVLSPGYDLHIMRLET